jgi:glycosylphosphatidylinositol transamidase (GPIT) subunit GPI8/ABC-type branched-subunit amino acid transport system substrate-binding protein
VSTSKALALTALLSACSSAEQPRAHIAIVLGSPKSAALRPVYDWSIAAVNEAGGAGGRTLVAKYITLSDEVLHSTEAQEAIANELLADPDLVAVAGTFSYAMAPKLVAAQTPYITPETGDDDVFRAFARGGYVWRTLESDSTQLWFMLAEAKGRGEKRGQSETRVALLASSDAYGDTFFDWYGFHASELGLDALPPVQYDQERERCEGPVDRVLAQGAPDFLIAAPSGRDPVAEATCIVRALKARGAASAVLLADSAYTPALLSSLGADAEGLSGFRAAPDPVSGFAEAFTTKTGLAESPEHAANALDAIALIAYGLEKSSGQGRAALDLAMRAVVDGRGTPTRWSDFGQAMHLIREGQAPDVAGASGDLSFDRELYTDPTESFFDRWQVQGGAFVTTHHVTTATEASPNVYTQSAVTRGLKMLAPSASVSSGGSPGLPPVRDRWALVIATSGGWANYRHQADALAHYQALRTNGFDDAHIVLITVDDLASSPENTLPGQVINQPGGPNLRVGLVNDDVGTALTPEQLMDVLEGKADPALPQVLASTADDNLYLFIVGHGGPEGPYLGMDTRAPSVDPAHFLDPFLLTRTIARMKQDGKFRRMLIAVDACHAGVLGPAIEAARVPDVLLLAAAAQAESSFSTNYASELGTWTADEFAFQLVEAVRAPELTLADLYARLYQRVLGSHVQVANQVNFGDLRTIRLDEFVRR